MSSTSGILYTLSTSCSFAVPGAAPAAAVSLAEAATMASLSCDSRSATSSRAWCMCVCVFVCVVCVWYGLFWVCPSFFVCSLL
jgi:hypothetical protein